LVCGLRFRSRGVRHTLIETNQGSESLRRGRIRAFSGSVLGRDYAARTRGTPAGTPSAEHVLLDTVSWVKVLGFGSK